MGRGRPRAWWPPWRAKAAAKPYLLWFWASVAPLAAALISGWLLWHRSLEQLGFVSVGVGALSLAGLTWLTGAIVLPQDTVGEDTLSPWRRSPVLRGIAIPVLAAAGIFMILAATSTGIGSALAPVAAGGFVVWDFGTATWGLLIPIIIWIGVGLYVLFSRDNRAAGGCVFAVLTAVLAFNSAILATDPQMWNFFVLQPFHDMWRLVGG